MKVTVCQWRDEDATLEQEWQAIAAHVRHEGSDVVLLPEMPFYHRFPATARFNQAIWDAAVEAHDRWELRLAELHPAIVIATRPVNFGNERYNQGFIWTLGDGTRSVHAETRLPGDRGVSWENRWFHDAPSDFVAVPTARLTIGLLIGAELFGGAQARQYRADRVDVLATPRTSGTPPLEQWLAAGRQAVTLAGAYCMSSGRVAAHASAAERAAGSGWVLAPDGELLTMTSDEEPIVTTTLNLPRLALAYDSKVPGNRPPDGEQVTHRTD